MCFSAVAFGGTVARAYALLVLEDIFARLWREGSEGGVGGRCCSGMKLDCMMANKSQDLAGMVMRGEVV